MCIVIRALGIEVTDKITKAMTLPEEDEVGVLNQVHHSSILQPLLCSLIINDVRFSQICMDSDIGSAQIRALCAAIMVSLLVNLVTLFFTSVRCDNRPEGRA